MLESRDASSASSSTSHFFFFFKPTCAIAPPVPKKQRRKSPAFLAATPESCGWLHNARRCLGALLGTDTAPEETFTAAPRYRSLQHPATNSQQGPGESAPSPSQAHKVRTSDTNIRLHAINKAAALQAITLVFDPGLSYPQHRSPGQQQGCSLQAHPSAAPRACFQARG